MHMADITQLTTLFTNMSTSGITSTTTLVAMQSAGTNMIYAVTLAVLLKYGT